MIKLEITITTYSDNSCNLATVGTFRSDSPQHEIDIYDRIYDLIGKIRDEENQRNIDTEAPDDPNPNSS